jgi:hypothetical protein
MLKLDYFIFRSKWVDGQTKTYFNDDLDTFWFVRQLRMTESIEWFCGVCENSSQEGGCGRGRRCCRKTSRAFGDPGYLGRVAINLHDFDFRNTHEIFWHGIMDFLSLCKVDEILIVVKSDEGFETEGQIRFSELHHNVHFNLKEAKETEFVKRLLYSSFISWDRLGN